MRNLFTSCKNSHYINIYNFEDIPSIGMNNIFLETPENLAYCIKNNSQNLNTINSLLDSKLCSLNDCSEYWKERQKKYIKEKNICLSDCTKNILYRYEYDNECYQQCPEGAYSYSDNYICKKDIICPENYPFESIKNNICLNESNTFDFFNNICKPNNQIFKVNKNFINNIINDINNGSLNNILLNFKN